MWAASDFAPHSETLGTPPDGRGYVATWMMGVWHVMDVLCGSDGYVQCELSK